MDNKLNGLLEYTIKKHWSKKCFSDFHGETYTFEEVASVIMRNHIVWEKAGFEKGFRIALCGRNSSMWATTLISAMSYGAVAVPLLNEFTPEQIHRLVNHSESKVLFTTQQIWKKLKIEEMPSLELVMLDTSDRKIVFSRSEDVKKLFDNEKELLAERYPEGLKADDINFYRHQSPDELLIINYTSGTTSDPKGVMIPERAVWSNMAFAQEVLPNLHCNMRVLSLLPTAHVYGMAFELMYEFCIGIDITFITKALSPFIIMTALAEVKPNLIIVVPLLLEKVVRKGVMPKWNSLKARIFRKLPYFRDIVYKKVREGLIESLGGNLYEVIIGGAALAPDVEDVLHQVGFPYTVGYGLTECAPILGYSDWKTFVPHSCGRPAPRMEIKIDSSDPANIPGEIVARGMNVMLGYYKNQEATDAAIDKDGWLHTGDMGVMDAGNNMFIRGRVKNMLLSGTGQNIYPEDVEKEISSIPYVAETVVVQRDTRLIALVYPDREAAAEAGLKDDAQIKKFFESHKAAINANLAAYSHVNMFEIVENEFEKTPKKSIKRFLYS